MTPKLRNVASALALGPLLLGATAIPELAVAQTLSASDASVNNPSARTPALWVAPPPVDALPALNPGDAYIQNNLTVNGTTNIKGLSSDTLTVTGKATTNGISNTGNIGTDTLSTAGKATIGGD
ncbi:MAG: hypothetical protein ACKO8I_14750, partial [Cyanobacteriota bacterium]